MAGIDLALFYLARRAEGLRSFERFVDSYKANGAGVDHSLVVIYKGFERDRDLAAARAVFGKCPHRKIQVTDDQYDIGAYLQAAAMVEADYVCFVNTHTEILAPNWLAYLRAAIDETNVGVAGASASCESLHNSLALIGKAVWLAAGANIPYDPLLAEHYRFTLKVHAREWLAQKRGNATYWFKHGQFHERDLEARWNSYWRSLCEPGQAMDFLDGFPRFPNPHIRTNGFMLRRALFLSFLNKVQPTKRSAYAFESGPNNLSATVLRSGKRLVLVDRKGRRYDREEWPLSRTFRLGNQEDMMLADNQTRGFEQMSAAERATHVLMTWGDAVADVSYGYPLGFRFNMNRRPATGAWATSEPPHIIDHLTYGVRHLATHTDAGVIKIHDDMWPPH